MKIPAVMIYSRKSKLVFCATFKMDISPHHSNKYTDAAAAAAAVLLNLFIALNCKEQRKSTDTLGGALCTRLHFMMFCIWFAQKLAKHLLECQRSRYIRSIASGTAEVKLLCVSANSIMPKFDANARVALKCIFRDECKINLLLFTKWYLLK